MISISTEKITSLISVFQTEINKYIVEAKSNLKSILYDYDSSLKSESKNYLNSLIGDFEKIVVADPVELEAYRKNLGLVPDDILTKKDSKISLKDEIERAIGYQSMRSNFFPKFFQKVGIKSCVYCNSQLTVSIESEKPEVKAKFQLDHKLPQSKYPCFGISIFNLYPVCGSCNNSKKEKEIDFDLYSDDSTKTENSEFNFELEKGSVAKFLITREIKDLVITFDEPRKTSTKKGPFQLTFDIEGIYDTQKDLAEELVLKSQVYDNAYRQTLADSFPQIFTHVSLSRRLFVGNYTKPNEIHKRPMAKFTQDIARQLTLIE